MITKEDFKKELLKEAQEQVKFWFDLAKEIYPNIDLQQLPETKVDLETKGHTAGKAYNLQNKISFNEVLLRENLKEFKERTIPHEVAHIVAHVVKHGTGHGREWKQVMRDFGVDSSRCHSYDVSNSTIRTVKQEFRYKCNCSEYMLTKIRHNRSQKFMQGKSSGSYKYSCTICKSALKYIPE